MDYTFQYRDKIGVGIEGADTLQGKLLTDLLFDHPWFTCAPLHKSDLVFNAVDEPYIAFGPPKQVFSIFPPINADRVEQIERSGYRIHHPSGLASSLALALYPLHKRFEIQRVHVVTTLPDARPISDYLEEVRALLGVEVSGKATQIPPSNELLHVVSVEFKERPARMNALVEVWQAYQAPQIVSTLPSAPDHLLQYIPGDALLQPIGRTVCVGSLEASLPWHCQFSIASDPVLCGPVGGSILNAELLVRAGLVYW